MHMISSGLDAIGYMDYYVGLHGDQSPTNEKCTILPFGITVHEIFLKYKDYYDAAAAAGQEVVTESHFYKLWRNNFSHVTYQKVG